MPLDVYLTGRLVLMGWKRMTTEITCHFHHSMSESSWLNFVDVNLDLLVELASVEFPHDVVNGPLNVIL